MIAAPATMRRIGIGLVAVCAALLTSACAAGQHAATANIVPAIDATGGTVGDLQLHDVAIKAPNGPSYQSGDAAELQLVIVNVGHAADTLQSVNSPAASGSQVFATSAEASAAASPSASGTPSTASGTPSGSGSASGSTSTSPSTSTSDSATASASGSASAPPLPTSLAVPPGQALALSVNDAGQVLLLRVNKVLFPGTTVPITFNFANAGSVTLAVPIQITANTTAGLTILPPSSSGAA